jgi:hypothetical protein
MDGGVGQRLMLGERPSILGLIRAALALSFVGFSGCLSSNAFQFHGTTAATFMRTIQESKDPNARYLAYDKLGSTRAYDDDAQKNVAAQLMAVKLKNGHEPIATRAVICRSLGVLRKPVAREAILAATYDEDALVRAEACRSLGRVGRPEDATILAQHSMLDASVECKVAAIESLGDLKTNDPRISELLIAGMEHPEPVIRVACLKTLRSITGKDVGVDPMAWKKYFEPNGPKPAAIPPSTDSVPAVGPGPAIRSELLPQLPPEIP